LGWIFLFFFVSGFCSILYEVIWLRLSMAQFGVTSAMVSIILSMFMAGLGLGSWISGRAARKFGPQIRGSALRVYSLVELTIGLSAMVVPYQLLAGRKLLDWLAVSSSPVYYLVSGAWVAVTLIPWCACMGATIPLGMLAIRSYFSDATHRSFSFLYLANVLGAVAGAVLPPLLIEIYGFRGTLRIGAILNGLLFVGAILLSVGLRQAGRDSISAPPDHDDSLSNERTGSFWVFVLLFMTGLTSMAGEVVWIRLFTPYLGTVVYAFALILGTYLASTFIGSRIYRYRSRRGAQAGLLAWGSLGLASLLPLVVTNPRFALPAYELLQLLRLALGIALFSGLLGYVTPMLVDRWSGGDPEQAGKAYAINVVGCIIGPLISGFMLLPVMSERWVLLVLAAPWFIVGVNPRMYVGPNAPALRTWQRYVCYGLTGAALVVVCTFKGVYEDPQTRHRVLRDNTATVVATEERGTKRLAVNGIAITSLTPMTKLMAHLPMAFLDHQPSSALVVCFGMGTTYRSLMSWNISTTAVELVPSVPRLFGYFHADGPKVMQAPLSHIVIDDGRRYLERTNEQYDVITLDPPPPVEAAGTSLLYSTEFYSSIRRRLKPRGILQQWLPGGDAVIQAAVARALQQSFPYVRVFHSLDNRGFHFLASEHRIVNRTARQLVDRMPDSAVQDLMEWGPAPNAADQFAIILGRELALDQMISSAPEAPALQDDHPENEYFFLRRHLHWKI
jgi:predicted membrane-bound spermidine synthase